MAGISIFLWRAVSSVLGPAARLASNGAVADSKVETMLSFNFLTAGRLAFTGLEGLSWSADSSGRVGAARRKRAFGVSVFFLTDAVAGFLFIAAIPCFLAMTSLPCKSLRWRNG